MRHHIECNDQIIASFAAKTDRDNCIELFKDIYDDCEFIEIDDED